MLVIDSLSDLAAETTLVRKSGLSTGDHVAKVNGYAPRGSDLPPRATLTLRAQGVGVDWRLADLLAGCHQEQQDGGSGEAGPGLCGVALVSILGGGSKAPVVEYSYPPSDSQAMGMGDAGGPGDGAVGAGEPTVSSLQGAFITLIDQLSTAVTMDLPTRSLILIGGRRTHVVLARLSSTYYLALGVPEMYLSAAALQQRSARAIRDLRYLFGDIARACGDEALRPRVDCYFHRLFSRTAPAQPADVVDFAASAAGALTLRCPADLSQEVADVLSTMYVHGGNSSLDSPGTPLLVGAALFYRGRAVHSQLPPGDLEAVADVCASFGFFHSSALDTVSELHYCTPLYRPSQASPNWLLVSRRGHAPPPSRMRLPAT